MMTLILKRLLRQSQAGSRGASCSPLQLAAEKWLHFVRPGGLVSEPAAGKGILSDDPEMHGFIHRDDVALLILRILSDPATIGRAFAVVDSGRMQCANPITLFALALI